MKDILKISLALMGLVLLFTACEKDDLPIDPNNAILGKWEITHLGNGADAPAYEDLFSYQEYLPDSISRYYNYREQRFYNEKYWIEDSLLYRSYLFIDAIDKDTTVFVDKYKFQFLNKNRLRLDYQNPAIFTTSIYKRIN
tara:strand:+ start:1057 stop:1476 length:420 start_codon:yes stop_codon:yes gene_type:complete